MRCPPPGAGNIGGARCVSWCGMGQAGRWLLGRDRGDVPGVLRAAGGRGAASTGGRGPGTSWRCRCGRGAQQESQHRFPRKGGTAARCPLAPPHRPGLARRGAGRLCRWHPARHTQQSPATAHRRARPRVCQLCPCYIPPHRPADSPSSRQRGDGQTNRQTDRVQRGPGAHRKPNLLFLAAGGAVPGRGYIQRYCCPVSG